MQDDFSSLTDAELEDLRTWVTIKHDHYANFLSKVNKAITHRAQTEMGLDTILPEKMGTREKIISILKDANKWLSSGEIIKLLRSKYQLLISANGLRSHLRDGEGNYFERKGKHKNTLWRLKKKKNESEK